MNKQYDAIIIGAGIIGAAIAFELAKKGYKTLNVDKLSSAGYGSTSGSCAIIRLHYSTPDGVSMAREGYHYWINWPEYLEAEDELGLVSYINTGCLVMKTAHNKYLKSVMTSLDDLGVEYEELDIAGIKKKVPFFGDIPVIGLIFRKTEKTITKRDLIIFLTPHIITPEIPSNS